MSAVTLTSTYNVKMIIDKKEGDYLSLLVTVLNMIWNIIEHKSEITMVMNQFGKFRRENPYIDFCDNKYITANNLTKLLSYYKKEWQSCQQFWANIHKPRFATDIKVEIFTCKEKQKD
ncbi:hypothetical protein C1646_662022 [Rhizophagus diaphanus]|nr:hypothetical protein C1646_662022 [Rhizophagus diaphanus] [Rhizophagus sp. MUCL 43196]